MASHKRSSSYASSSNPTRRRTWKYDIFLSFRGEDTRRGFTSHLYGALIRSGFGVFRDDEELRRGDSISSKLLQAIEESFIAIVILSENYASSSWCLDELQHILASRNNEGQIVFPIFYDVDPSNVRKQSDPFGKAFAKLKKKFPKDQSKVQKWRDSLTEVANLSGFDSRQYPNEAELIDNVVEHLCKVSSEQPPVSVSEAIIGIESRVLEMFSVLQIGLNDVRFIGIWGMGGVGKTTLARTVYERFHYQFDFQCFLANVRESSERNGLLHLQNQLLSQLKPIHFQIEDMYLGKSILSHIFQNRKVMLILDDVNHLSQLENLAGSRGWFGNGSRIIITTRDADLLRSHLLDEKRPPGVDEIYEIKPMSVSEDLWVKLRSELPPVSVSEALIGIEWRVEEMVSVLEIGLDDVRFIGIWGMGGVGKTTLARTFYERFHHQFDFHCFLANVREVSERNGLHHLQNKLLSHLNKNWQIEDTDQGKSRLGHIFQNRKVMIILDDVNLESQLENLAGSRRWFGHGSRIIITTRDADLLRFHPVDEIHEVKPMNHDESLQLFRQKVFRGDPPTKHVLELTELIINYANGLPLALCVLGSYFSRRKEIEWEGALKILKKNSKNDIFKVLRLSYEGLDDETKTIFLDIACFFNMWGKIEVTQILESCGLEATTGMNNLIDKSLLVEIELGNIKYIEMHDLVQEMGRLIVSDEYLDDLGRRSRLWYSHDIDQVLKRNMGTGATKGVVLPFTYEKDEANWDPASFLRMDLLRLLIISCNFSLRRDLKGFPWALKVLHWYGYPSEALPSMEEMDQLVYLKMQNSKIKRLSIDTQSVNELKILDMSHSRNLLETPNFFGFQNLKRLLLEGCISLVEIHSSLGQLPFLVEVNFKDCLNLEVLPKKLETNSLEEFVLGGCIQVRNLPEFGEEVKKLIVLDVKQTSIAELPESLGSLTSIETLDLMGCLNLVGLPHNFHKLKRLKVLDISGCSSFSKLPKNLNKNEALEKLDANGTAIVEVPSSICYLKKLKTLAFHGCKEPSSNSSIWSLAWNRMLQRHSFAKGLTLPASIFNIESLTELDLSYCGIVDGIIPNDLGGLSSLQKLDLSGNEFENLPDGCISNILNLKYLYLNSCPKLQFLPQPSPGLHLMDASESGSLRTLSDQKLLHLFTSIEQDGQHAEGSRRIASFSVTIPGSEIPSWFENQNHLPLNEKHVASVTIDIPEGEWLGIGLCTVIDDKICLPRWGFDFKASNGMHVSVPGRTRGQEKEIKSSHLWMVFWKTKEEKRGEVSRNYSQIRLKFCTDREQPQPRLLDIESIMCGWRSIHRGDLERLMDGI